MTLRLSLPSALVSWFRHVPSVPDVVAPPDRPEWEKELARHRGISEIVNTTREDVQRQARILRPSDHGYAFTFTRKR